MEIWDKFKEIFDNPSRKNDVYSVYLKVICRDLRLGREHFLWRHTINECKSIAQDLNVDQLTICKMWQEVLRDVVLYVIYLDPDVYNNNCYERWDCVWSMNNPRYWKFYYNY